MAEEEEGNKHIIIDNGSCYIKAGFGEDEEPKSVFPTILGENPKYKRIFGGDTKEFYVGPNAEAKLGLLNFKSPIKRAVIKDWDIMEKIWDHIFTNELRVAPEEHNLIISQPVNNIKENKEKIAEIMFESFNIPGLYIADSALLSAYAAGKFTGMVIDMGDGITQFSPIYEGFLLEDKCERINIGGKDITKYMRKILNKKGYKFSKDSEKYIARAIKEKACYISLSKDEVETFEYELPDGNIVNIKEERTEAPEAIIFDSSLIFKEEKNIPEICNNIIQKCNIDIKKDLYNCIILSGGNSMFKGLPEKFTNEIKDLVNESMKEEIKVIANPERKFATWIGGAILSGVSSIDDKWTTKEEYGENGPNIIIDRF